MNNKKLAIIFGGLLLLYLLSKLMGGNRERSFDPTIVQIDTSKVTHIEVHPSQQGDVFSLDRQGGGSWNISSQGKTYTATDNAVRSLLSNLSSIEAERIVSKNPEKYLDYGLDEATRTRIELFGGSQLLGGVDVGRFNYNQATRGGTSYIKRSEDPEVFSVEGFLSMSLNQAMDNYRDKRVVESSKADLTRISYRTNREERIYSRRNGQWVNMNENQLDSAKMDQYLNSLASVSGNAFADDPALVGASLGQLVIEGNNMAGPIEVECFMSQDTTQDFVISSSSNAEGKFFSDSSGIYKRLIGDLLQVGLQE